MNKEKLSLTDGEPPPERRPPLSSLHGLCSVCRCGAPGRLGEPRLEFEKKRSRAGYDPISSYKLDVPAPSRGSEQ